MDNLNTSLIVESLESKVKKLIAQHDKAKEDIKQLKELGFVTKHTVDQFLKDRGIK